MSTFLFNGDWRYEIEIPSFGDFQSGRGVHKSKDNLIKSSGKITLEIEDDLSESPDPYPEQLSTIEYIFENHPLIMDRILSWMLSELPEIIQNYGLSDDPSFQNFSKESIKELFGINSIHILIPSKNGLAYYDVCGYCSWDEEHGLNFLMHQDRILTSGGIEGNSYWDAIKDNGTYEALAQESKEPAVPRKYEAHPKYNKLKPSQKLANETFEYDLIAQGFNQKFKDLVEKGEINIDGRWESQDKTWLEAACWFNNLELIEFLLSKGAQIRYALHQCAGYSSNPAAMDLILKYGGNINQQDKSGNTILGLNAEALAQLYNHRNQSKQYNWGREVEWEEKIETQKLRIKKLIGQGSDLKIKNTYGYDVYATTRNLPPQDQQEIMDFFNSCIPKNNIRKEEPIRIRKEMQEVIVKTYPSKIGLELLLPILFILLSTSALMVTSKSWLGLLIILVVLTFILHLFLNTNYTIEGHQLTVKSGFLYNSTIDIQTITKVSETNNLISSPAISLDRLEIRYGSHNSVIISPREKQDFLDHLLRINAEISVQYKNR